MLGYIPVDQPRVAVARDGTVAAIHELTRITFVRIPDGAPFAVVEVDAAAAGTDIAWIGTRLLVLARFATHSIVRVVEPKGPRKLAERRLESVMHLRASVDGRHQDDGGFGLACSDVGAAIVSFANNQIVVQPFSTRVVPVVVGAADARFVVVSGAAIEEWDPVGLVPKRRLRLPPTTTGATLTTVGGTARVLWWTTREQPQRIEVMPLVTRGQPRSHELAEPIAQVASHQDSDLLVCRGAASGRVDVIDLEGRLPARVVDTAPVERADALGLVVGRHVCVLASEVGRRTSCVSIAGRSRGPIATWRDEVVAWTRSGVINRIPVIDAIDDLARRLELPPRLIPAIALCYGAHLCGAPGVPPSDIANILGGKSDGGRLAASGVLTVTDEWITLTPAVCRLLDES